MSARRKIPTKAELIQLQKLYKTDERIGERLGGVPAYLVAYWRRKKNLPKHSQPKFSESEIRTLWERFGDDDRCGLELGISKAAFYNWRRRYGIREKPAFLKLEQLELNLPGLPQRGRTTSLYGKQSVTQKILAQAAQLEKVTVGELVVVEPDLVVLNQDAADIIRPFKSIGVEYVWNPGKIIIGLGHCEDVNSHSAADNKTIREFARHQQLTNLYDIHEGAYQQLALENGHLLPGQLALGTNKYAVSYGAMGLCATGIDATEMAAVWASGRIWLKVPPTIRIDINGRRPRGVYAKDVVLSVIGKLGPQAAEYKAIEYYGQAVSRMSISERFTLCHLSAEIGAKFVSCPFESVTRRYLAGRTTSSLQPVIADKDAEYEAMFQFNIDNLLPQIAGPDNINQIRPVADLDRLTIHQIIIGTCGNGRFDDLRIAADILKGKKVHPDCRLIVAPCSRTVYLEALKKGLVRALVDAGAMVVSPGCSWYAQGFDNIVAPDERCLATVNGNFAKRAGANGAEIYLCSPATAAASALNGHITDPTPYVR